MPNKSKKWVVKPSEGRGGTIQRLVKAQAE
jgi:predicted ATP-grasp superfamily ATP-dependent carboligase